MNHGQPGKIQIAQIHQVNGPSFENQTVQDIDLVGLAVSDVNEAGDIAAQVQQGVQLDGGLGLAKRHPGKHRQAQLDGTGIECVNRSV